jgi:hypothetical protein
MALEGPRLFYPLNADIGDGEPTLARALRLAREVEELLEETSSVVPSHRVSDAHSTRIAQAMAASLVDELEAIVRGARKATNHS